MWKGKRVEDSGRDLSTVESLLQKSIALDDSLAEAHVQLGNLYADQHKYEKSIPQYERALALDPNLSDAHYRLGTDYVHVGKKENAQKEFAVYQKLRAEHLAEVEKERAEVQQFVYSEKGHHQQAVIEGRGGPMANLRDELITIRRRSAQGLEPAALPRCASARETARGLSRSRRDFLRGTAGVALGSALMSASPFLRGETARKKRKVIVITFGGGARDQETFAPEGQENIPNMLHELAPQSSFFTHVTNQGILGHYVATASLATGVYETLNNFSAVPPEHPTVFEYFRKDLKRPSSDAWVVAPSNGFNRIGESDCRSYGQGRAPA